MITVINLPVVTHSFPSSPPPSLTILATKIPRRYMHLQVIALIQWKES